MKIGAGFMWFALCFCPSAWGQMLIMPSEAYKQAALCAMSAGDRALMANGPSFYVDAELAVLEPPRSSRRSTRMEDIYKISWMDFFKASDMKISSNKNTKIIKIINIKTLTRAFVDSGDESPQFILKIEWLSPRGKKAVATGEAVGPPYESHGDVRTQPESIRSSNIAFYEAYLKAMAQIAEDLAAEFRRPSPPFN